MTATDPLALVTAARLEVADDDRPILDQLLAERGLSAEWVVWDDPSVDWARFTAAWIRSPWDYTADQPRFMAWAERVAGATRLWNPAPVVAWNSHKSYLLDLADQGVPVVETVLVRAGHDLDLVATMAQEGWAEAVVKPAVAVGAFGAQRVAAAAAAAWVDQGGGRADHDRLVQPLVPEVAAGETSLVVVDGAVTHAVRKVPGPGDFRVHVEHGGRELAHDPTGAELDLADQALAAVAKRFADPVGDTPLLYARVDCVTTVEGPRLMELELIEPSLFLWLAPPTAGSALADAVTARL